MSFKKLKNWKILPVAGSLFLILAKDFLKFTPFLQNYQVFKCKSANLCNKVSKTWRFYAWEAVITPNNPHPTHLDSRWEISEDSPSLLSLLHNLFASDWCALTILTEWFWKNILKIIWNVKKKFNILFVTSISESSFINIWHWLDNTIFQAKTILTGDVNLDKPDLSITMRVIF